MRRREFLKTSLGASALIPLASTGLLARPLLSWDLPRASWASDRVLVLINLNGGNDGLNTVIPYTDQRYHDARKVLAIREKDALKITGYYGLHPRMPEVAGLYKDGACAIVQNVGYPNPDRSHFRSTDIWNSASASNVTLNTGWTGRYLEAIHPEYPVTIPGAPFAIQVSNSTTLLIQGARGSLGMALDSPDRFYDLANGLTVDTDPVPVSRAGEQLKYIRQIIVEADIYSKEINRAITQGTNRVAYGKDTLSAQLKGVARLINGGLATSIYVVTLGGFDTHLKQPETHAELLGNLSSAVKSFLADMTASGSQDRIVCMTYSEFGRRLAENGSAGTDHGAAAPQMLFGKPVLGGNVVGSKPNLDDLDGRGDIKQSIDFRQIYATVLQDWLGFGKADTATVLGGEFAKLPLFAVAGVDEETPQSGTNDTLRLEQNIPNPVRTRSTIVFSTQRGGHATLSLSDARGGFVASLFDGYVSAGTQSVDCDLSGLPAGNYIYTVQFGGRALSRKLQVVR